MSPWGHFTALCFSAMLMVWFVSCDPVVNTTTGQVRGQQTERSRRFLGIPYGAPPVGDLRWRSPRKAVSWAPNVLNATAHAPGCPQKFCVKYMPNISCPNETSEDCLYLNVWTPVPRKGAGPYPVMVFIHGGAFKWGSTRSNIYDGDKFVWRGNVVLVTIEYRIGLLGFLYTGDEVDDSRGNFGIRDQRLALQWVQENIANFNGNPKTVTVFGESAGAQSVAIHMSSPNSEGLFHSAIIESSPFAVPYRSKELAIHLSSAVAKILKCPVGNMGCLRSKTVDEVSNAQDDSIFRITASEFVDYFEPIGPVLDGVDVFEQPMTAAANGHVRNIPTIVGTNAEEGRLFVYGLWKLNMTKTEYEAALALIHPKHIKEMEDQYKEADVHDLRDALSQFLTDYMFTCSTRNVSMNLLKNKANVYRYVYDHASTVHRGWGQDTFCYGHVCHAEELGFVFGTALGVNATKDEALLSDSLIKFWTNFAHTSNPNIGPLPVTTNWPVYRAMNASLMHFKTPSNELLPSYREEFCDFWDDIGFDV